MDERVRHAEHDVRFSLAQASVLLVAFVTGSLIVEWVVDRTYRAFFSYYGASVVEYEAVRVRTAGVIEITGTQIVAGFVALVATVAFIARERRRVAREVAECARCVADHDDVVSTPISRRAWFDRLVLRSSAFAGVLFATWLIEISYLRSRTEYGWGMEYADWRSVLPLASIFGLCVLVGMVVAAFSLVGARAILLLQDALASLAGRIVRRRAGDRRLRARVDDIIVEAGDVGGYDEQSRPPPTIQVRDLQHGARVHARRGDVGPTPVGDVCTTRPAAALGDMVIRSAAGIACRRRRLPRGTGRESACTDPLILPMVRYGARTRTRGGGRQDRHRRASSARRVPPVGVSAHLHLRHVARARGSDCA